MPFKKGQVTNPKGRQKGVPNKTTAEVKEIVNTIISDQIGKVGSTLDAIRETDPDKYLNMLFKLMEFVMPKKRDVTSDDEPLRNPINIHVTDARIGAELKKLLE
jgi:hypothetical protein